MKKSAVLFIALAFYIGLQNSPAYSQDMPVKVKAATDRRIITVGEPFTYRLLISYPEGTDIKIPDISSTSGNFNVKKGAVKKSVLFNRIKAAYTMNSFKEGTGTIPSFNIEYRIKGSGTWQSVSTNPITVEVKDIIIEKAYEIKSVKGPLGFLHVYKTELISAVSAVSLFALYFIIIIALKIIKSRPKPVIWPDETALRQLKNIDELFLKEKIDAKTFFTKTIDTLREYIEARYEIRASKMTTQQFKETVMAIGEISAENKNSVVGLLKTKDDIQFARGEVTKQQCQKAAEFVKKFIHSTKERA